MPSSEAAPDPRWARCLATAGVTLAIVLLAVLARVTWFDAYWIFREHPPWLEATGGANRLIDRQTRRAKVLQALTRDYEIALLGSSTTYHGLDPRDVDPPFAGHVFNVGISALLGDELPVVASVVASRRSLRRVVIGLDYYMFSRLNAPVGLSRSLSEPTGRGNALLGSALSEYALHDSRLAEVAGGDDPGSWTRDGFRITPKLPPALTEENDSIRRRTTAGYRPEALAALGRALDRLAGRQIEIFLAPVNPAQRRILAERNLLGDLAAWRADVARLAGLHHVPVYDLADLGARYPFDPAQGSTDAWIDNLHFTPLIGRQVLEAVGLRSPGRAASSSP